MIKEKIFELEDNFHKIKERKSDVSNFLKLVYEKVKKLKLLYVEFVEEKIKNFITFGLDSFIFQK